MGCRRKTTVVGFKWRTLLEDGELQMLQMKSSGCLPLSTTIVRFRWRATALGYRRRTTMVSLKWRTTSLGNRQRTTLVGFKGRTSVVGGKLQVKNYSGEQQQWVVDGEQQW